MSTATLDPPLRAVFTPTDAADAAQVLAQQKSRWAHFLIARDAVIDAARGIWSRALQLVEKLGLTSVVQMARRGLGWLLKGLERTSEYLRAPGVRPGLLWALTTSWGHKAASGVAKKAGYVVGTALSWTYRTVLTGLRRLGIPGQKLADRLEVTTARAGQRLARLRPAVEGAALVLSPSGLVVKAINSWAQFKMVTALVARRLPRPWNWLAVGLAGWTAVPAGMRVQAYKVVADLVSANPEDDEPTPPAGMRLVPPPAFSAPETDAISQVMDPEPKAVNDDALMSDAMARSLQYRPAAKRSANGKKRR